VERLANKTRYAWPGIEFLAVAGVIAILGLLSRSLLGASLGLLASAGLLAASTSRSTGWECLRCHAFISSPSLTDCPGCGVRVRDAAEERKPA
jgi:hypothetical protein